MKINNTVIETSPSVILPKYVIVQSPTRFAGKSKQILEGKLNIFDKTPSILMTAADRADTAEMFLKSFEINSKIPKILVSYLGYIFLNHESINQNEEELSNGTDPIVQQNQSRKQEEVRDLIKKALNDVEIADVIGLLFLFEQFLSMCESEQIPLQLFIHHPGLKLQTTRSEKWMALLNKLKIDYGITDPINKNI